MTMTEPNEQKVWQSNKTRFLLYVYFSHFSSSGKQETSFWLRTHRIFSQVTDNHKIRTLVYGVRQTQPQRWNSFGAFGLSTNSKFFKRDLMVTSERQQKETWKLGKGQKELDVDVFWNVDKDRSSLLRQELLAVNGSVERPSSFGRRS